MTPTSRCVTSGHRYAAGATVTVDTVLTATTDAQGKFSFAQVPAGDVDVVITAAGYKDYSAPARLEPDKPLNLSISLTKL